MSEQCCGLCEHYEPERNPETKRALPSRPGRCSFKVTWPTLPACYDQTTWRPYPINMWPGGGSVCLCFSPKKKPKKDEKRLFEISEIRETKP